MGKIAGQVHRSFDDRIEELRLYRKNHGDRPVTSKCGIKGLYRWLGAQINAARQGRLEASKVTKLVEAGIVLPVSKAAASKKNSYLDRGDVSRALFTALQKYYEENGHCNIPRVYAPHPELGRYVSRVRKAYHDGKLTQNEITKLNTVKFDFSAGIADPEGDLEERIALLEQFRKETRKEQPSRNDPNKPYANLAGWIHRMRRYYRGGSVSSSVVSRLREVGIDLGSEYKANWVGGETLEALAFQRNMEILTRWLATKEQEDSERDLAYRDIRRCTDSAKAYRFFEHMVNKSRSGLLSVEHRQALLDLDFTFNLKPVDLALDPAPSIRSVEGIAITRARKVVRDAEEQAERAARVARQASEAEAAAKERIRLAELRVAELEDRAHQEMSDLAAAAAEQKANMPSQNGSAYTYLTTEELAARIKYNARTIRDQLLPRVFVEHLHYIRPFGGRKVLYLWENIERDMLTGAFSGQKI